MAELPADARTILTDLSVWDGIARLAANTLIIDGGRIDGICDRSTLSPLDARRASYSISAANSDTRATNRAGSTRWG